MDRSIPAGEPTVAARRIATAAVDQLGPGDLAAVVTSSHFAGDGRQQNFTADRTRLLSSINSPFMGMVSTPEAGHALPSLPPGFPDLRVGDCVCGLCVLESLTAAFDPKGRPQGSHRQTVEITWGPGTGGARSSEVLSRLDLKPGHYEIRVAAANIAARSGSVYTYVDVPNFADDPLSLSGVVLEQARATDSTPAGAIADLLPVVPTSQRSFTHADRVTAFVRAYQGGKDPVVRVQVTTQIVSTEGRAVEDESTVIAADRFGPARAADHRIELPIERLAAGEYVLILQATAGSRHTQRNIRFRVLGIP